MIGHEYAIHFRGGDRYFAVQPCRLAAVSSLSDRQSDREPYGFPGHLHASVACLSGGIGLSGDSPATSPTCPGTSGMDIAPGPGDIVD